MKRIGRILFVCLAVAMGASAQDQDRLPLITVSDSAVVRVVPDEIDLTVGVETRATSLSDAQQKNEARTKSVIESLKSSGVEAKDLQIEFVRVEPSYGNEDKRKEALFYSVTRRIGAKIRKVSKFEATLTSALTAGATHVEEFQYKSSELRKYRDEARVLAVRAAKQKAENLAKELGVKVGKAHSIRETTFDLGGMNNRNVGFQASSEHVTDERGLAIGVIEITARIEISFLLE